MSDSLPVIEVHYAGALKVARYRYSSGSEFELLPGPPLSDDLRTTTFHCWPATLG